MTKDRGFNKLKGKTIKAVRVDAINQILLLCDDGTLFEITDGGGISIILEKHKEKLDALPRRKKTDLFGLTDTVDTSAISDWPFPSSADKFPGGSKSFDEKKGRVPTATEVVKKKKV
jgi:hypothetical protein